MKLNLDEIEKALGEFSEVEDLSHFYAHAPEWLRLLVERVRKLDNIVCDLQAVQKSFGEDGEAYERMMKNLELLDKESA